MGLEVGTYFDDLVNTNPLQNDPVGRGDDHLRLIKSVIQNTFPNQGAIFGTLTQQDVATTILRTANNTGFLVTNSTTTSVSIGLPASASITTGWSFNFLATNAYAVINRNGADTINGGAAFSIPPNNMGKVNYLGSGLFQAVAIPAGQGGNHFFAGNVTISGNAVLGGTLSVSGATSLLSTLSVSGATSLLSTLSVSGATVLAGALTVEGDVTISGSTIFKSAVTFSASVHMVSLLDLQVGQIKFPATQNASANANTLDDYEEGTFTPALTFATPGTLSVVYSAQVGVYTKIGRNIQLEVELNCSTITLGTASGNLQITGMPFTPAAAPFTNVGASYTPNINIAATRTFATVLQSSGTSLAIFFYDSLNSTPGIVGANNIGTSGIFIVSLNYNI